MTLDFFDDLVKPSKYTAAYEEFDNLLAESFNLTNNTKTVSKVNLFEANILNSLTEDNIQSILHTICEADNSIDPVELNSELNSMSGTTLKDKFSTWMSHTSPKIKAALMAAVMAASSAGAQASTTVDTESAAYKAGYTAAVKQMNAVKGKKNCDYKSPETSDVTVYTKDGEHVEPSKTSNVCYSNTPGTTDIVDYM